MTSPNTTRALVATFAGVLLLTMSACAPQGDDAEVVQPAEPPAFAQFVTDPDIPVIEDVPYGTADGEPLLLDACFPRDTAIDDPGSPPRPAIVAIHGGSWQHGDKATLDWRSICQWFAAEGFVAVSVNYRLAPASTFPAQLDDVAQAVRWLRDPAQVERYNLDPDRIGAFGGSAGGNLAALLGTSGSGSWTDGARVAAVVDLSGPNDVRAPIITGPGYSRDFATVQLEYLGCADFADCPAAAAASPITLVDASDPPFFVAHSIDEFIPLSQSEEFVEALRAAGVDTTFVALRGTLHATAMLDDEMRARVIAFFRDSLGHDAAEVRAQPADPGPADPAPADPDPADPADPEE